MNSGNEARDDRHPLLMVRNAMSEASGKIVSQAALGEMIGLSESKVRKIEARSGDRRQKFNREAAAKLFHEAGAILHPFIAFKGTSDEIKPEPGEALNLDGDPYCSENYAMELEIRKPHRIDFSDEDLQVERECKERALQRQGEALRGTMVLARILLLAAIEGGRFWEVRNRLWHAMEGCRTEFKMDEGIKKAFELWNRKQDKIPISELAIHPRMRHLVDFGDDRAEKALLDFQKRIEKECGSKAEFRIDYMWPQNFSDDSLLTKARIGGFTEEAGKERAWWIKVTDCNGEWKKYKLKF